MPCIFEAVSILHVFVLQAFLLFGIITLSKIEIYGIGYLNDKFNGYGDKIKKIFEDLPKVEVQNSSANADKLQKYKNLLDNCTITQEEFDAKKKQLLDL